VIWKVMEKVSRNFCQRMGAMILPTGGIVKLDSVREE